jgi:ElaB/YqjD/DUF883 family membrane-anchored ribosome-binding protein
MEAQISNSILSAAIVVIAIAVVLQTVSAVVSAMAVFKVKASVDEARAQFEPLAADAKKVLDEARNNLRETNEKLQPILASAIAITQNVKEVTHKTNEIVTRGQAQAERLDTVLTDTVERARVQMDNVEKTMDHVLRTVRDTSTHVNQGILSPIRKVNGIVNGPARYP